MSKIRSVRVVAMATLAGAAVSVHGQTWLGGNGDWQDDSMWSGGSQPNNGGFDVFIDGGNGVNSVVVLRASRSVRNLTIDAFDELLIRGTGRLELFGNIFNDGTLRLRDVDVNGASLRLSGGSSTISGAGRVVFDSAETNTITTGSDSWTLTIGADQLVTTTAGSIGSFDVNTVNNGEVFADAGRINYQAGHSVTNNGALRAGNGGVIDFLSNNVINNNGLLEAEAGGLLEFTSASVNGGSISGAGSVGLSGSHSFTNVTLDIAGFVVGGNNTISIFGNLTNNTNLRLADNTVNASSLRLGGGSATIDGTGTISFETDESNVLTTGSDAWTLTIGAGQSLRTTSGGEALVDVNTVIAGNVDANDGVFRFEAGHSVANQSGSFGATNGGRLDFASTNTINNGGRSLFADGMSVVEFNSTSLNGGSVDGQGTLELNGSSTFNGVTLNIATVDLDGNTTLNLASDLVNNTTILMTDATVNSASLRLSNGSAAVNGVGEIVFNSDESNVITTASDSWTFTLGADQVIRTTGGSRGSVDVNSVVQGGVFADNGEVRFEGGHVVSNNGVLRAVNGGGLVFASGNVVNNNGVFEAADAMSRISMTSGTVNGGAIDGMGELRFAGSSTLNGVTLNIDDVLIGNSQTMNITGFLTNNTRVVLRDIGVNSALVRLSSGPAMIGGTGSFVFDSNESNVFTTASDSWTLTLGAGQTVTTSLMSNGSFDLNLVNNGDILADGGTVRFEAGHSITNGGSIGAVNGGEIVFASGNTIAQNGSLFAGETGRVSLTSGTVNGGAIDGMGELRFGGSSTLNGVTLNIADVVIGNLDTVNIVGGLTNNTSVVLRDFGTSIAAVRLSGGPQAVSGDGSFVFGSEQTNRFTTANDGWALTFGGGQLVTTAVGGEGSFDLNTVVNGRVVADDGRITYEAGHSVVNSCEISAVNGGTVRFASGNTVSGAGVFSADAMSDIELVSGVVNGSTVSGDGLFSLFGSSTFANAGLSIAETRITNGATLNFVGTLRVDGTLRFLDAGTGVASARLSGGPATITGTGVVLFDSDQTNQFTTANDGWALTIAPEVTVTASAGSDGQFDVNTNLGGTLNVLGDVFVAAGHVFNIQSTGVVRGTGVLDADQGNTLNNAGVIEPGIGIGRLTIEGDVNNSAGSVLRVEVAGTQEGVAADLLRVVGAFGTGAIALEIDFKPGAEMLSAGDTVRIVDAEALFGAEAFASVSVINGGSGAVSVVFDAANGDILLTGFEDIVVPAPGAVSVLGVALFARRRR